MIKNPLRTAAWSLLALLIISLFITPFILTSSLSLESPSKYSLVTISLIVYAVIYFLAFNGFIHLGKKYKIATLKVGAWLVIIVLILTSTFSFQLASSISKVMQEEGINEESFSQLSESQQETIILNLISEHGETITKLSIFFLFFLFIGMIIQVVFGIGVLKLKEVALAKTVGILFIIGAVTTIFFIGLAITFVALVLSIIMFFKEAEKSELAPKRENTKTKVKAKQNGKGQKKRK